MLDDLLAQRSSTILPAQGGDCALDQTKAAIVVFELAFYVACKLPAALSHHNARSVSNAPRIRRTGECLYLPVEECQQSKQSKQSKQVSYCPLV